jgi:hypothetical protein
LLMHLILECYQAINGQIAGVGLLNS